jgi:hypothetical protein
MPLMLPQDQSGAPISKANPKELCRALCQEGLLQLYSFPVKTAVPYRNLCGTSEHRAMSGATSDS